MIAPALPIHVALPELLGALSAGARAVLQAPPGAGKTTGVPLALMEQGWARGGAILMLEPRRVAARTAAERMAETLGEAVGQSIGYRIRGEAKVSAATRVEIVTEGVLTRRIQSDPELQGVAAVIFDEFHERSLNADLGLALCLEAQEALRPDLRLLVMSATLDGTAVSRLMGGAPVITSEGRAFPVETHWLDAPWSRPGQRGPRIEEAVADLTLRALDESPGDALVFLPGVGEIGRVEAILKRQLSDTVDARPLHGEMPVAAQRAALRPSTPGRRRVVLATAVAETSLTVEGVTIVVDSGLARRARFDPGSGMGRLVTERVTKAEAEQRRGRAGRTAPGVCWRLWTKGEEGGLAPFAPAEIETADLTALALELSLWGSGNLKFLNPPPEGALAGAQALLTGLGALDAGGAVTPHGRKMAAAPLHPRLAHMVLKGAELGLGGLACDLAALLEERDLLRVPGAPRPGVGLAERLAALRGRPPKGAEGRRDRIRRSAGDLRRRMKITEGAGGVSDLGRLTALAYPDRIALRRSGGEARYLLSGGKGAKLSAEDPLSAQPMLVAADLDGDAREAQIRLAAPISRAEVEGLYADRIKEQRLCLWSKRDRTVQARIQRRFGALTLEDRAWKDADASALADAMTDGVRQLGLDALPWTREATALLNRLRFAGQQRGDWPDWSEAALTAGLERWLTPFLTGLRSAADLSKLDLLAALEADLGWERKGELDRVAPARFQTPAGSRLLIDYGRDRPTVSVRAQEMFGLSTHPMAGDTPLMVELLSPAGRPIASTVDLPGFWNGAWADARKDMRGRYPKHHWPENPETAAPTTRAKPRRG